MLLLRDQLRNYTSVASTFDAQTLVHSETEARKELAVAKERLAILEDLLGEGGAVEVKELAERVLAGEKRVQVLELEKRGMDLVRLLGFYVRSLRPIVADKSWVTDRLRICCTLRLIDFLLRGRRSTNRMVIKCLIWLRWKRKYNV